MRKGTELNMCTEMESRNLYGTEKCHTVNTACDVLWVCTRNEVRFRKDTRSKPLLWLLK
jgi:hypothetical protein